MRTITLIIHNFTAFSWCYSAKIYYDIKIFIKKQWIIDITSFLKEEFSVTDIKTCLDVSRMRCWVIRFMRRNADMHPSRVLHGSELQPIQNILCYKNAYRMQMNVSTNQFFWKKISNIISYNFQMYWGIVKLHAVNIWCNVFMIKRKDNIPNYKCSLMYRNSC